MQSIWFAPTNYVTGDPSLLVSYPSVSHPGTIVESQSTGDLKWIAMSLSLKEFGAYRDGVHDDTAAVTAAINASNAASFTAMGLSDSSRRRTSISQQVFT
jgi:hypothetical protein